MFFTQNIKEYQDQYLLEQVNCLEKPILMLLENYDEVYYHLVLLFHKLIQSYEIKDFLGDIIGSRTLHRLQAILKEEFCIDLHCELEINDIGIFIRNQLDDNNPVIVPVDLFELYYSEHYKKTHWVHSFLVYNYNAEKELFYIIDTIQQNGNGYQKFCVTENMLRTMFSSLNNTIYNEGIYCIKTNSVKTDLSIQEIRNHIYNCISQLCEKDLSLRCRALNRMKQKKLFELFDKNEISQYIVERIKYKEVLYLELEWLLKFIQADNLIGDFLNVKTKLINEWKKISNKIVYCIYKGQLNQINPSLDDVAKLESEMYKCLIDLKFDLNKMCINRVVNKYLFINNEDNIISQQKEDDFIFNFNNDKIYDNWIDDCAPRVLLKNFLFNTNQLTVVKTKVELLTRNLDANYIAGFYLKTKNNERYMVGAKSGVSICMDHSSNNPCLFSAEKCADVLELSISVKKNYVNILCVDALTHEQIMNKEVLLDSEICEIGLSCKTWGFFNPVKVIFNGFIVK